MANLVLAFGELLAGGILVDAAIKGDSIGNVIRGQATQHPLGAGVGTSALTGGAAGAAGASAGASTGSYQPGFLQAGSSTSRGSGYVNPVPGANTGRIDQGVDYTLGSKGFVAPAESQIIVSQQSSSGWGGGGYLAAKILSGPLKGAVYFVAEGIRPLYGVGKKVAAGTPLVSLAHNPYNGTVGNIEAGWANPQHPSVPLAGDFYTHQSDQSMTALAQGYSFSRFVQSLGGTAGEFQGAGISLENRIKALFAGGRKPAGVPY